MLKGPEKRLDEDLEIDSETAEGVSGGVFLGAKFEEGAHPFELGSKHLKDDPKTKAGKELKE
jgi:hypothetical protein